MVDVAAGAEYDGAAGGDLCAAGVVAECGARGGRTAGRGAGWGFGRAVVQAVVALPLVLPPTVLGFYLLVALGPLTAPGRLLISVVGHPLAFSFAGLLVGSVIYSLPFAVQPLVAGFAAVDRGYVDAAAGLGATPWRTFWQVVLPLARTSLLTSAVLTFTHTVGEFGVVLMLGGNIAGATRTLSIALFDQVQDFNYRGGGPDGVAAAGILAGGAAADLSSAGLSWSGRGRRLGGVNLFDFSDSPPAPRLTVAMRHRQGALTLDVAFSLTRPWTVLFGPSGSGKSTVLRGIAGVLRPEQMRLVRDGSVVLEDTERGIFLPAYARGVRWAAQVPALFPHMSVRENLRFAGADAAAVTEGLERFRLDGVRGEDAGGALGWRAAEGVDCAGGGGWRRGAAAG